MDAKEALAALRHAQYQMEYAAEQAASAARYYGRMYDTALRLVPERQLIEEDYPRPAHRPAAPQAPAAPGRRPGAPEHVERLLLVEEVAAMIERTPSALRYMIHAGKAPPSAKIGGRRMFKLSEVQAWIDAQFAAEAATGMDAIEAERREINPFGGTAKSRSASRRRPKPPDGYVP